ncbi:hypothetical protein [Bradyrhizobium japonicum]|uniref:hypothetical protein n=1 Tax=Bradyrhizobium japonicum TaxID=375 RepID=UPI0004B71A8C|nr:hypothetical protein [Bradyrhizobium japonicum]
MTLPNLMRQSHRWLGIILTLTILANFVVRAFATPPAYVVYAPLPPLALSLISGLYMFFRPYLRKNDELRQ